MASASGRNYVTGRARTKGGASGFEIWCADLAYPYSVAFTHYVTSAIHLLRDEPRDSIVHADRSLEISREHRINLYAN